jgi:hypothetical protein
VEKETRWNSGAPMTDEERRECVEALRGFKYLNWLDKAADEIERLTAENKKLGDRLLEYAAERNAEFFFASFPEKRTDWMKDD